MAAVFSLNTGPIQYNIVVQISPFDQGFWTSVNRQWTNRAVKYYKYAYRANVINPQNDQ